MQTNLFYFSINISQNLFDERNHKSLVPWANEFYFCQCSEENDKKAQAYKYNETRIDCLPDLQHMCYDEGGNPLTCAYARRKRSTDRHRSHVTRKSVMFDIKQVKIIIIIPIFKTFLIYSRHRQYIKGDLSDLFISYLSAIY